jgi:tRNA(Ile)-lysidine synthase
MTDAAEGRPRLTPAMADVRRAVREGFEAAGLQPGDLVLVACSGGADSLALAAAAAFEGPRFGGAEKNDTGLKVGAVVIDHGMQAGSGEIAGVTAIKLQRLGLFPVEIRTVVVGTDGGPEAAARAARYAALDKVAEESGAKAILLGHTLNDQAETVLMGLARGSGAKSLNGMAPNTTQNGVTYLRPLLGIKRETTESFCADSGLEPWHDPMNKDVAYTRVRVRQNLLPALEAELGPGIAEALARTADTLREDDEVLASLALDAYKMVAKEQATQIVIGVEEFKALPLAIRHRVVALAAVVLQAPMLSRVHILAIDELVDSWHGQKPLSLPGIRVERTGETIALKTTKTLKTGAC